MFKLILECFVCKWHKKIEYGGCENESFNALQVSECIHGRSVLVLVVICMHWVIRLSFGRVLELRLKHDPEESQNSQRQRIYMALGYNGGDFEQS